VRELAARQEAMRARLEQGLSELGAAVFGEDAPRIPNTSYFAFKGIVGFGAACELAAGRVRELAARQEAMRARLEQGLNDLGAAVFGEDAPRIPNTSYFAFKGIVGETLVIELDKAGYAVAPGAACSSANPEPSATLLAMGVDPEIALGAVRFSLGAGNTVPQIDEFLKALKSVVTRLRSLTAMAV